MPTAPRTADGPGPSALPLRVLRVLPGESWNVRFLASELSGLLTHWDKKKSHPCLQKTCPSEIHRLPSYWKGYAPVLVWQTRSKNWMRTVLEVTEHLELDLRGRDLCGEEWTVSREPQSAKRRTPVVGRYLQTVSSVPEPFDIRPCLIHLYHSTELVFGAANKLPPRPMVEPVEGPPPFGETADADKEVSPEERRLAFEAFKKAKNRLSGGGNGNGNGNGNDPH